MQHREREYAPSIRDAHPAKSAAEAKQIVGIAGPGRFTFDTERNLIVWRGLAIELSAQETHILRILFNNRGQTTTTKALIEGLPGAAASAVAAAAIRAAIASLRRKLAGTGIEIKPLQKFGYEIIAFKVPELNRRLSDRILLAMSQAVDTGNKEVAEQLHVALELAKESEQLWLERHRAKEKRAIPQGR